MNTILSVPPLKSYYQPSFQSCLSLNPAIPRFPFCLFIVPFFSKFHWCLSGPVCFFLFVRSLHYFLTFLPDVSLCLSFLPFLPVFPFCVSFLTDLSFLPFPYFSFLVVFSVFSACIFCYAVSFYNEKNVQHTVCLMSCWFSKTLEFFK